MHRRHDYLVFFHDVLQCNEVSYVNTGGISQVVIGKVQIDDQRRAVYFAGEDLQAVAVGCFS